MMEVLQHASTRDPAVIMESSFRSVRFLVEKFPVLKEMGSMYQLEEESQLCSVKIWKQSSSWTEQMTSG